LDKGAIVITTQDEFEKIEDESNDKLVVIDVYAPWCGPCVSFAPKYKSIGYEFLEKATFLKVDGDANKWAMSFFNAKCYPTIVFRKNKTELTRMEGAGANFRELVEKYTE